MTIKQAAQTLQVSVKRVYALIRDGTLTVKENSVPMNVEMRSIVLYQENRRPAGRPACKH